MLVRSILERGLAGLLELVAPPRCALCAAPAACSPPRLFCGRCGGPLRSSSGIGETGGVRVVAPFRYAPPISDVVKQLKYSGRCDLAPPLGRLLAGELARLALSGEELIVPVPLHPRRLAARGYNQAALIARAAAWSLRRLRPRSSFLVLPRALERSVDTPQQALLQPSARELNVRQAFRVRAPAHLAGRPVVLVDDVVTTGATALACVACLLDAGARVITVAAICTAMRQ